MSIRKDKVQLSIEFLTDESKAFARTIEDTKKLNQELAAVQKKGGDVNATIQKIVDSGKSLAGLDLKNVMPAQLTQRAEQLKNALKFIPEMHPSRVQMEKELKSINDRLAEMGTKTKGVSASMAAMRGTGTAIGGLAAPIRLVSQLASTMWATILGPIAIAIAAIRALWGAVSGGVGAAAEVEQTSVAFEVLAGGAQNAQALTKALFDFAAKTPFELPQVNEAAKKLLAYGYSASEVVPTLQKIGDVAAAVGVPIDELAAIFGKAKLGEFIQAEELNQLADRGIPVFESLAKQLGVSTAEVKKMGSEGKINFKNLEVAFNELAGAGGRFNGMMDKQSGTFNGLMSTLKDNTSRLLSNTFKPLMEGLKPILAWLSTQMGNLADGVTSFYQISAASWAGFKAGVQAAVDNAVVLFERLRINVLIAGGEVAKALTFDKKTKEAQQNVLNAMYAQRDRLAVAGKSVGEAFSTAYKESIQQSIADAKFQEEVSKKTTQAATRSAADIEKAERDRLKRVKDALDLELKDKEIFYRREELVNEIAYARREKTENEFNSAQLRIERDKYAALIGVYDTYQSAFGKKTEEFRDLELKRLEAQSKIAQAAAILDRNRATDATAPLAVGLPTAVNQSATGSALNRLQTEESLKLAIVERNFARQIIAEQQFEAEKARIRAEYAAARLAEAERSGETEKGQIARLNAEKIAADKNYQDTIQSNEKRTAELKAELEQQKLRNANRAFGVAIELLSKDEAARKKNAGAIKAFQIAQVIIDGISEVQAIRLNAAKNPINWLPGGAITARILSGIQQAIAVASTIASVNRIAATKFATGGIAALKSGIFGGKPHSAGGTTGYFDDGTVVEVEQDEAFAVVNKRNTPLLRNLSLINAYGGNGRPFFALGGLLSPTSLPTGFNNAFGSLGFADSATSAATIAAKLDTLTAVVAAQQSNLRAVVVLDELETLQNRVAQDRASASY